MRGPRSGRTLRIAVVYPDLLGTYGDGGNGAVLARRAAWRGVDVELLQAVSDRPLPRADLYCVGGGEDGPEVRAAAQLNGEGGLHRSVDEGAVVLAVCAGYQLVGTRFPDASGRLHDGCGLLDVSTVKGQGGRAVGELLARPDDLAPRQADGRPLPTLSGFENHGGVTELGSDVRPLARVTAGVGNGRDGTEGAWSGRVVGTYLHGPVLARNPAVADLLLGWALAEPGAGPVPLDPVDDGPAEELRRERLAAVGAREARWAGMPARLRRVAGRLSGHR